MLKEFFELQGKKSYSLRLNIELLLQRAFISDRSFFFSVKREFVIALQESKSVSKNTTRKDKKNRRKVCENSSVANSLTQTAKSSFTLSPMGHYTLMLKHS